MKRWKLLKLAIAMGLLVAALAGGGGGIASAHGKDKVPSPAPIGPSGQPFIIPFD